ncbi:MAG: GGDEF domain-containing protein [Treponema sp.]|nr:GGDEF domain-containing protein [Treponema sp.]
MDYKRKRIGLQIGSLDNGLQTDIFTAVEKNCKNRNLDLLVFVGGDPDSADAHFLQATIYQHITKKNVDSLIVTSESFLRWEKEIQAKNAKIVSDLEITSHSEDGELNEAEIDAVVNMHNARQGIPDPVPAVYIKETSLGIPYVTSNYVESLYQLIDHVVMMHGCKTFTIVTGKKETTDTNHRLEVCLQRLAHHDIQMSPERIFSGMLNESSGAAAMDYFDKSGLLPVDCIIALDDDMAIGIAMYARKHGLNIPGDFRLIAIDDIVRSQFANVTISTLNMHLGERIENAVSLAEQMAEGKPIPPCTVVTSVPRFRKSCGCIPLDDYSTNYIDESGARVPYEAMAVHNLTANYFVLEHDIFLMRQFFGNLNAALTLQHALNHLEQSLPSLHMCACAVVLFERKMEFSPGDSFIIPSRATLVLTYEDPRLKTGQHDDSESCEKMFDPSKELLPEGTFSDRRRMLMVKALHYENTLFGYVAYEPGDLHLALYDTAFSMVASILNAAILFTQQTAIEQHQRTMLQQLGDANNELTGRSFTDELTSVYNRRGVFNFGQQAMDLALERGQCGMVFYADMDGLKGINDTFGHDAGDIAIKTMADILKNTFRSQDVVGRMGGDEFVIVAIGLFPEQLDKIRERVKKAEADWYTAHKPPFHLGISFGVVPFNQQTGGILDELVKEADKLLYEEKVKKHSRSATKESVLKYED